MAGGFRLGKGLGSFPCLRLSCSVSHPKSDTTQESQPGHPSLPLCSHLRGWALVKSRLRAPEGLSGMWVQHLPPPSPILPHSCPTPCPTATQHSCTFVSLGCCRMPPLSAPRHGHSHPQGHPETPCTPCSVGWVGVGSPPCSLSPGTELGWGWQPLGGLGDNPGVLHPRSPVRAYVTAVLQSALLSHRCHRQSCSAEPGSLDSCVLGRRGREGDS